MTTPVSGQTQIFLLTVAIGFGIGFIYDIFRFLRRIFKHPNFLIQLEDLLYWIIVLLVMFYMMLDRNEGEIRAFNIIGSFLGMLLYFQTLSPVVLNVSVGVADFIKKILMAVLRIVLFPIGIFVRILNVPFQFLRTTAHSTLKSSGKVLQKSARYAKMKSAKTMRELKIILKKK